jgi:serine/threonine protein kinase
MVSERLQRRIEAFLDEADAAAQRYDWSRVGESARAALAIDAANADALTFLRMAEANLAAPPTKPEQPVESSTSAEQPPSFVNGRYEVRRFLGEGGKKKVFLAHDRLLDRDVAFALIKTEGLDDVGRQRVAREAQAMGRMGAHPHLVSVFDLGEEGGAPYLVTELMGGGDVEGELERAGGPLELSRALDVAKGVARGLIYAHERGIVHRDLKPGNVWLTSEGIAKIGDFGLAMAAGRSRLTQHGMMVGTFAYMPPEQALGGEVTPRSDLYSLGAMLYELVTGKPPFEADDPTAVISQHLNAEPVAPSWRTDRCPAALEDLVLALLAKDPSTRPASAAEVLSILDAIDPDAPSRSHSSDSTNPLDRLARGVFVGRERELERLRGALDDALAGRGSVVMLIGEHGV